MCIHRVSEVVCNRDYTPALCVWVGEAYQLAVVGRAAANVSRKFGAGVRLFDRGLSLCPLRQRLVAWHFFSLDHLAAEGRN